MLLSNTNSILCIRDKVYEGKDFDFKTELCNPNCWFLCDVSLPSQVVARTVLVCSIDNGVISVSPFVLLLHVLTYSVLRMFP